jgi:prepilin-type N-terminal cleavage/methylation domain-containing protein/prepilin-type processing-associated H-X9-DG protein
VRGFIATAADGSLAVRRGLTLVELLVVVAIVSGLVSLLLPAVQSARESGRRAVCAGNLKQLAVAFTAYRESQNSFPANGWGYLWGGPHPDRGLGIEQPGGWGYSILPFLEQNALYDAGRCGDPTSMTSAVLLAGNVGRVATPVPVFFCPTRRGPGPADVHADAHQIIRAPRLVGTISRAAMTDYAANAGERIVSFGEGPATFALAAGYGFPDLGAVTGITHVRSRFGPEHVHDGTSHTLLVAEKCVSPDDYRSTLDLGDDQGPFASDERDTVRWTATAGGAYLAPARDMRAADQSQSWRWGSAHAGGFTAAMCDGSVRTIDYDLAENVMRALANRRDGQAITASGP